MGQCKMFVLLLAVFYRAYLMWHYGLTILSLNFFFANTLLNGNAVFT